jgi:hypothetical protein
MSDHNPIQCIKQLQSILSSPSKKIGFVFGAGISVKDINGQNLIPAVEEMTKSVVLKFNQPESKKAIQLMKDEVLTVDQKMFNIETLLSKISEKERAVGSETLCGLTKVKLTELRVAIEEEVRKFVSVHNKGTGIDIENTNHNTLAKWISNADREFPIEIFTTNYDYLLELALEKQKISYFDGFVGSYESFFCPEWIEGGKEVKDWTKLWKLHGSLGWKQNKVNEIVRTSGESGTAMIYPSFLKYDHSKKQPYLSYMDRLSKFLKQEDSVLFVCGYSFGDEHINEIILTALTHARSSHVFVLKRGELKESDFLSKNISQKNSKISVYAGSSAVIGGKYGVWSNPSPQESSAFFEQDKAADGKKKESGKFLLGDFKNFTNFLSDFYKKY